MVEPDLQPREQHMMIVAGQVIVDSAQRESSLTECLSVVEQARRAAGWLDFSIFADLVDPGRINVFERCETQADVKTFRGSGPQ